MSNPASVNIDVEPRELAPLTPLHWSASVARFAGELMVLSILPVLTIGAVRGLQLTSLVSDPLSQYRALGAGLVFGVPVGLMWLGCWRLYLRA